LKIKLIYSSVCIKNDIHSLSAPGAASILSVNTGYFPDCFIESLIFPASYRSVKINACRAETNGQLLEIECLGLATSVNEPEHIHPLQGNFFKVISGSCIFIAMTSSRTIFPDIRDHYSLCS